MKNAISLRRQALDRYFGGINESQRRAVFQVSGPLLILAGAGSGKTTVLINRIENMILFGDAYNAEAAPPLPEQDALLLESYIQGGELASRELSRIISRGGITPWSILAITFTNKAAAELRGRLEKRLGYETASEIMASTFHSLCVRILRRESDRIGYGSGFTIYDADDSIRVVKNSIKLAGLDEKMFPPRPLLGEISRAKDSLMNAADYRQATGEDYRKKSIATVYELYEAALKNANAMDFDDLIYQTVRLFRQYPDILEKYRARYRYIMVDEYQDTNHAQYVLISQLAGGLGNLCVVGDDDQSIYKFRGATIENILSFEQQFPGAAVVRLEQNYRSTGNILNAANEVISHNTERKGKTLWTADGPGDKVRVERVSDEEEESRLIAETVLENVKNGARFSEHAVLYRMNAQSGTVERALAKSAIPYRIIGGVRFYERKEVKDMLAYLTLLNNPADNLRLARIVNEPARGIGAITIDSAQEISRTLGISLFEVLKTSEQYASTSRRTATLTAFTQLIEQLSELAGEQPPEAVLEAILDRTGYRAMLEAQGLEGAVRLENILELKSNLIRYGQENPEPSIGGFLEEIALYTDLDNYDPNADNMVLMTIHSAKGLEFEHIFIAGMDEGIFPGRNAMNFPQEIEEERRLAYVAITRARKKLMIVSAIKRLLFGQTVYNQPSRFIREIPAQYAEFTDRTANRAPVRTAAPARPAAEPRAATNIGVGKQARTEQAGGVFAAGERLEHSVFGQGVILSTKAMGGDTLLEIEFDKAGVKKIMANYAKLTKI